MSLSSPSTSNKFTLRSICLALFFAVFIKNVLNVSDVIPESVKILLALLGLPFSNPK